MPVKMKEEIKPQKYVLLSQGSALLLNIKPGNPQSAQQTQPAGLRAVCRQRKLHLQ